jgi:peptide subunit release factor RF-3
MTKTHKDRVNLINRLERKYAKKMQLQRQKQRQNIKNALRSMRGHRVDTEDLRTEAIDGIFRHGTRTA